MALWLIALLLMGPEVQSCLLIPVCIYLSAAFWVLFHCSSLSLFICSHEVRMQMKRGEMEQNLIKMCLFLSLQVLGGGGYQIVKKKSTPNKVKELKTDYNLLKMKARGGAGREAANLGRQRSPGVSCQRQSVFHCTWLQPNTCCCSGVSIFAWWG